jgi:hypothetical protein
MILPPSDAQSIGHGVKVLEARAELTERAESTLKEQIARERERADMLEEELQQERSKRLSEKWVFSSGSSVPYHA